MQIKLSTITILTALLISSCASYATGDMTDEEAPSASMTAMVEVIKSAEPTMATAPTRTVAPTDTPELEMGTFSNPYPFDWKENSTWRVEYDDWSSDNILKYEVGITDISWGDDRWVRVQNANSYNDPPEEGTEFLCVLIWIKNIGDHPIEKISVLDFKTVSDGTLFGCAWEVPPSPRLDIEGLFPGGEAEGWGVFIIKEGDTDPLFSFYEDPIEIPSLIQLVRP